MTVIYVITKVLTFPGALTKALFEQIMCRIFKCPVEDNRYFRTDEMCGHIEHELINRPVASFMFCLIPGLLNFSLAMNLCLFPLINIVFLGNYSGFVSATPLSTIFTEPAMVKTIDVILPFFFAWLCISLLSNLFPIIEDAVVMKEQYKNLKPVLKVLFFPAYIVMKVGSRLEKYGITLVFLIALTVLLAIIPV